MKKFEKEIGTSSAVSPSGVLKWSVKIGINLKSIKNRAMNWIESILYSIGPITTCIGLILGVIKHEKISKLLIIAGVTISLLSIPLNILVSEKASSTSGEISSNFKNITYPCVQMGGTFSCDNQRGAIEFNNDIIYVGVENGKLKISAKVRDESGKIMGEIINNSFESYSYALKSRHDNNGWEVIDPYGRVALQVDLIGAYAHIAGISYAANGNVVMIAPTSEPLIFLSGPNEQLKEEIARLWEKNPNIIPPIFDYTSDEHSGKRIKR